LPLAPAVASAIRPGLRSVKRAGLRQP